MQRQDSVGCCWVAVTDQEITVKTIKLVFQIFIHQSSKFSNLAENMNIEA